MSPSSVSPSSLESAQSTVAPGPQPFSPTGTGARPVASRQRDPSIEGLRGLALVLLVGLHATAAPEAGQTTVGNEHFSIYEYLAQSLAYIRMPLFTIISGFVYSMRPLGTGNPLRFLKGKARRLMLPFACAVTLTLSLAHITGSDLAIPWQEAYRAYLYRYTHFWFLQAILLVFLVIAFLESRRWLERPLPWLVALALASTAKFVLPGSHFFSFSGFLYLLPFFILGLGLYRFQAQLSAPAIAWPVALIALVAIGTQQLAIMSDLSLSLTEERVLGTVIGLAATFTLMRVRRPLPLLATIGGFSYTVYLYHHIGISIGQRMYLTLGGDHYDVLFLCKLLSGITAGIAIELLVKRIPVLRTVVLGLAARPKSRVASVAAKSEANEPAHAQSA